MGGMDLVSQGDIRAFANGSRLYMSVVPEKAWGYIGHVTTPDRDFYDRAVWTVLDEGYVALTRTLRDGLGTQTYSGVVHGGKYPQIAGLFTQSDDPNKACYVWGAKFWPPKELPAKPGIATPVRFEHTTEENFHPQINGASFFLITNNYRLTLRLHQDDPATPWDGSIQEDDRFDDLRNISVGPVWGVGWIEFDRILPDGLAQHYQGVILPSDDKNMRPAMFGLFRTGDSFVPWGAFAQDYWRNLQAPQGDLAVPIWANGFPFHLHLQFVEDRHEGHFWRGFFGEDNEKLQFVRYLPPWIAFRRLLPDGAIQEYSGLLLMPSSEGLSAFGLFTQEPDPAHGYYLWGA